MYDILDKIQRIQTFLSSENITFFSIINSHTSQKAGSTDGARDRQKSRIQLQGKLGRIHGETLAGDSRQSGNSHNSEKFAARV